MKTPFFLLLFACFGLQLQAQNNIIDNFYHTHKRADNTVNVMLPGLVLQLGLPILKANVDTHVERNALDLLQDVRSVKLLVTTQREMPEKHRSRFLRDLSEEGFEPLVQVRSKDQQVDVVIREKNDIVRNLVVFVNDNEDDEVIFFSLKTKIHLEDLEAIINDAIAESE
ncbi:MAG: DUF4252 domain-containing protein [Bacteroidota bacterium]